MTAAETELAVRLMISYEASQQKLVAADLHETGLRQQLAAATLAELVILQAQPADLQQRLAAAEAMELGFKQRDHWSIHRRVSGAGSVQYYCVVKRDL